MTEQAAATPKRRAPRRKLDAQRLAFVEAYGNHASPTFKNLRDSLLAAGYSESTATSQGPRVLRDPLVQQALIQRAMSTVPSLIQGNKTASTNVEELKGFLVGARKFTLRQLFEADPTDPRKWIPRPFDEMDLSYIESVRITNSQKAQILEFKLVQKIQAGRLLAQLEGALNDDGTARRPFNLGIFIGARPGQAPLPAGDVAIAVNVGEAPGQPKAGP